MREKENIDGPTAEFTKENGKKTNSMEKEYTHGLTAGCTRETTRTIRNMVWAPTPGQMANLMKDNGRTASSMERPDSPIPRAEAKWASGKMVKESNGLMQNRHSCRRAPHKAVNLKFKNLNKMLQMNHPQSDVFFA